jgi:hypothetical protein
MVKRLADRSVEPGDALGFLSMNASGFVREEATREEATRRMVRGKQKHALAYLFLRSVDHVPTIAELAARALRKHLLKSDRRQLAELIAMWQAPWFKGERTEAARVELDRLFADTRGTEALLETLSLDLPSRRAAATSCQVGPSLASPWHSWVRRTS